MFVFQYSPQMKELKPAHAEPFNVLVLNEKSKGFQESRASVRDLTEQFLSTIHSH